MAVSTKEISTARSRTKSAYNVNLKTQSRNKKIKKKRPSTSKASRKRNFMSEEYMEMTNR